MANSIIEQLSPSTDEAWLQALRTEPFNTRKSLIDTDNEQLDDESVHVLIAFLRTQYKKVIILLDNIDRYELNLQAEVVTKAVDLAGDCTPLIAVRTNNLQRLKRREAEGRYGDRVHVHATVSSRSRTAEIATSVKTIEEFISKRISFLRGLPDSQYFPLRAERHLGDFEGLLRKVLDVNVSSSVVGFLDHWYNHSLRHIGSAISMLIGRLIARTDPAYTADNIVRAGHPEKFKLRRLRNSLYKFIICGNNCLYAPERGVLNVYDSPSATSTMPFPELALLSYLHRKVGSPLVSDVRALFGDAGITPSEFLRVVQRLERAQGTDGFGFVQVEDRGDHELPDNALLELLPSGEVFLEQLSLTCEYLVWAGLDARLNPPLTGETINYISTGIDDELRVWLAAKFIELRILPWTQRAHRLSVSRPTDAAAHDRTWGAAGEHLTALIMSLRKYADMRGQRSDETRRILDKVEKALASPEFQAQH